MLTVDVTIYISPSEGDDGKETLIPTSSSIQAAKEKREQARKTGVTDDFVSLSLTKRDDHAQGPHPMSRLVREEDELGEGDDGKFYRLSMIFVSSYLTWRATHAEYAGFTGAQERIALGKKSRKLEAKKKREEMNELIADA